MGYEHLNPQGKFKKMEDVLCEEHLDFFKY